MRLHWRSSHALLLIAALSLLASACSSEAAAKHPEPKHLAATKDGKLAEMKDHKQSKEHASKLDDGSEEGPSFVQIWEIREYFARMFGYCLVGGIMIIISVCCLTQPGCFVYDKFFDKGPQAPLDDEEQAMMGGNGQDKT